MLPSIDSNPSISPKSPLFRRMRINSSVCPLCAFSRRYCFTCTHNIFILMYFNRTIIHLHTKQNFTRTSDTHARTHTHYTTHQCLHYTTHTHTHYTHTHAYTTPHTDTHYPHQCLHYTTTNAYTTPHTNAHTHHTPLPHYTTHQHTTPPPHYTTHQCPH